MTVNRIDAAWAEVMAVLDRRLDAMRAKDIDLAMLSYSPNIVYFDIIPPPQFVGADAVRQNFLITHEHISFPINPDDWSAVVGVAP